MKRPQLAAKIATTNSSSTLPQSDAQFEPLSPLANKVPKHFPKEEEEEKKAAITEEATTDEKKPQHTYPPVPQINRRMRWLRRILALSNQNGKLLHPKEWSSPTEPMYDDSVAVDPLNLSETSGEAHIDSRTFFDTRVEALETKMWDDFFQPQGDQARLSFSLFEDIWHLLTVDLPLAKVLLLEISLELLLIILTTIFLTLLALAMGENSLDTTGELFVFKLLLSLSTVRLSTDSVWGWREGPISPPIEVILLSLHSWLHWLLLNVASAIVVARAMRPIKQVTFTNDCVLDQEFLNIRLQILRFKTVGLKNLSISLSATGNDGVFFDLPLTNGMNNIPMWRGAGPMNIKHQITQDSPLHPSKQVKLNLIRISLQATDTSGLPVNETMTWYDMSSIFMTDGATRNFKDKGVKPPQIIYGAKWRDAYSFYKNFPHLPALSVDLNNFTRAVVSEPPKPVLGDDNNL